MCSKRGGAEQTGVEQHAVEAAKLLGEGFGHAAVVGGGALQIHRRRWAADNWRPIWSYTA